MIMVIKNPSNSHLSPLDVPGGDKPPSKMGVLIYSDRKTCSVVVPDEVEILKKKLTIREGCRKSKWKFKMAFAIRRPTPPPP